MNKFIGKFFIVLGLFTLLFLAACQPQTVTVEETITTSEDSIEDAPSAIGSEDDSGALPPPINSGSKIETSQASEGSVIVDLLLIIEVSEVTAVSLAELEENWESLQEQISTLPTQPEARYAAIVVSPTLELPLATTDFLLTPSWDSLSAVDGTNENRTNDFNRAIAQLSWAEETSQLIFMLVSPTAFDGTSLQVENAFYFPLTPQSLNLSETDILAYEAFMEDKNGRIINLNDTSQSTLSEQIILAVAEVLVTVQN